MPLQSGERHSEPVQVITAPAAEARDLAADGQNDQSDDGDRHQEPNVVVALGQGDDEFEPAQGQDQKRPGEPDPPGPPGLLGRREQLIVAEPPVPRARSPH